MRRAWFWLRWSARDLRRRWVQVAVIALVVAIGTGLYAGMSSVTDWARLSYDESYATLHAHDLRVALSEGSVVPQGSLADALASMDHPNWVAAAEERLIVATQVDASTSAETVLVPGRLVGVPVEDGGPHVDGFEVRAGRGLSEGSRAALLEWHFADHYELPASGAIRLAGETAVPYAGTALSPEYYMVTSGRGDFLAEANFAVVFLPLPAAQGVAGRADEVNDLVIALHDGVDARAAEAEVERALAAALPAVGTTITALEEDPAHRLLYEDLEGDRGTFQALAVIVLLAAAIAAFNLAGRIVEAQRREIGIGMALGVPRGRIALRPMLAGAEMAVLGAVFGVGIGYLVGAGMHQVYSTMLPLPIWRTPFELAPYAKAAALGLLVPVAATASPVWRAIRVAPVDAIRTGHLAARGGGLAPLLARVRMPGRSLAQMPVRNVLRAPRRTILTALGIGAAIVSMVVVLGALDSFHGILDRGRAEIGRGAKDRLEVTLADYERTDSDVVRAIEGAPSVGAADPTTTVAATVSHGGADLVIEIHALDLASPIWHPTVTDAVPAGDLPGIVLARKALEDLGVGSGDTVTLLHPYRTSGSTFGLRETTMRVVGAHPNPMRFLAYVDRLDASVFGLAGLANALQVVPARGVSIGEVERALFGLPGVAAIQEPGAIIEVTSDLLERFTGMFRVAEAFALLLALLIAFNAASIAVDERAREHATMAAFGVPPRTLLRMATIESGIVGAIGTIIGLLAGALSLMWMVDRAAGELPEIDMPTVVSSGTVLATLVFGIVIVGLAPLFTARKLRRMDVPSTLRVME
jgi:putative ABC transport system permease protein